MNFTTFVGHFALLDPDPDPMTRLNPDPIRIRICNPGACSKEAIKQYTCYRYLCGFQEGNQSIINQLAIIKSRQSSNQLDTGTRWVSEAGNQAINLLPVPVGFPKQAIK
jgi:hypothetical protein